MFQFCISTVNPGLKMTLGGSYEPSGHIQISSIGGIGPEENKKLIEAFTNHIQQVLGIPKHKWDDNEIVLNNHIIMKCNNFLFLYIFSWSELLIAWLLFIFY